MEYSIKIVLCSSLYPGQHFVETEDHIEVDDLVFHKPFVEKPLSAEDHNVFIYFPESAGGGSQRLFRKVSVCCEVGCHL